jgi:hypothetical protein
LSDLPQSEEQKQSLWYLNRKDKTTFTQNSQKPGTNSTNQRGTNSEQTQTTDASYVRPSIIQKKTNADSKHEVLSQLKNDEEKSAQCKDLSLLSPFISSASLHSWNQSQEEQPCQTKTETVWKRKKHKKKYHDKRHTDQEFNVGNLDHQRIIHKQAAHIQTFKENKIRNSRPTEDLELNDEDRDEQRNDSEIELSASNKEDTSDKTVQQTSIFDNSISQNPKQLQNDNYLSELAKALGAMKEVIRASKVTKLSVAKAQLRNLLCEGSLYISNSGRQRHFRKLIGAIANERDLIEFLNKCLEDFNTTFGYELSKYDNTFPY